VTKLSLIATLLAAFLMTSCKTLEVRTEYVPELVPTKCPTGRAPKLEAPADPDDGAIKRKHQELAFGYNALAEKYDGLSECVETFDTKATQSQPSK